MFRERASPTLAFFQRGVRFAHRLQPPPRHPPRRIQERSPHRHRQTLKCRTWRVHFPSAGARLSRAARTQRARPLSASAATTTTVTPRAFRRRPGFSCALISATFPSSTPSSFPITPASSRSRSSASTPGPPASASTLPSPLRAQPWLTSACLRPCPTAPRALTFACRPKRGSSGSGAPTTSASRWSWTARVAPRAPFPSSMPASSAFQSAAPSTSLTASWDCTLAAGNCLPLPTTRARAWPTPPWQTPLSSTARCVRLPSTTSTCCTLLRFRGPRPRRGPRAPTGFCSRPPMFRPQTQTATRLP
eukprot:m.170505 g.170505  ORF g.170505 m.170505 type:complete len:305 (+) comp17829_c5_seq1:1306-2220(+)